MRHDTLYLRHRDDRQKAAEDQKAGEEESEAAQQCCDFDAGGAVARPVGWEKVPMETGHDDHEPLKPHPDVDQETEAEYQPNVRSDSPEPQELRDKHIEIGRAS